MRRPALSSLSRATVEYPSSDGKPLAENDAQLAAILYAVGALRVYFAGRSDVYVSGDLLIYYEEGNPRVSVAPDVFEEHVARQREAIARRQEVAARQAAEARVAELEALIGGQRG